MKIKPTLLGEAGEHQVAMRLSLMGFTVAMVRNGSDSIDLLVWAPDPSGARGRSFSVQVKALRAALDPAVRSGAASKSPPMPVIDKSKGARCGRRPTAMADFYALGFLRVDPAGGAPVWDFVIMTADEVLADGKQDASGFYLPTAAVRNPAHREAWAKSAPL